MIVLKEHLGSDGLRVLDCIAGPAWPSVLFITLPGIVGLSFIVSSHLLDSEAAGVRCVYWALTAVVCGCLVAVALSDPGLSRFYSTPPPGCEAWPFSQQSKSYRPPQALYSRECNCVVEEYDHTCPWTGTAIGRKNAGLFHCFLYSLYVLLFFDFAAAVHSMAPGWGWTATFGLLAAVAAASGVLGSCLVRAAEPPHLDYGAVLESIHVPALV